MSAQIAFTLTDQEKKSIFQNKLSADGLTVKAFFNFCINAYLDKTIQLGVIVPHHDTSKYIDSDEYLAGRSDQEQDAVDFIDTLKKRYAYPTT